MLENLKIFYARGDDWKAADNEIRRMRSQATQTSLPALDQLQAAANYEVAFQYALWDHNPVGALEAAKKILGILQDDGLKGYRGLWNYFAGDTAALVAELGISDMSGVAKEYYHIAAKTIPAVHWFWELADRRDGRALEDTRRGVSAAPLIERLERQFAELGTRHDDKFVKVERVILEGIEQDEYKKFENAQKELGKLLGFDAGNVETVAAPDGWWIADHTFAIVFEDYTQAEDKTELGVNKARQVASHPIWLKTKFNLPDSAMIIPVLVSNIKGAEQDAAMHLQDVAFWKTDEFRVWARNALSVIRNLRTKYPGPGDLFWREEAMEAYATNGMDPASLRQRLIPLRCAATF